MKFGRVPLDEAEGALLIHSLTFKAKTPKLRKGQQITSSDIDKLRSAGYNSVMAAQLETGDVREDTAAARVGSVAAGYNVYTSAPFTGRCNLHAQAHGLLKINRTNVNGFNRIDESVTLATLPPFAVVNRNQLVATVKIIPLSVTETVLQCCTRGINDGDALVSVSPFVPQSIGILLTELPGMKSSVLDKSVDTLSTRASALGSQIKKEVRCPHDSEAVAAALTDLLSSDCSPIVMFGASAIVDRRDIVPLAIESAGGKIDRLGMPVDPGNLILLAHHERTKILGVPGSARSPRLNGIDYLLPRLLANVPLDGNDMADMGVGGLLKEIPGRPHPREKQRKLETASSTQTQSRIAVIVLAAGQSRRMGKTNKLLADINGKPMVTRVVDEVLASHAVSIIVVTGYEKDRIKKALMDREVKFVHNPDFASGLSTSLICGLNNLPKSIDGVLTCLGDMPQIKSQHLNRLIEAFEPNENRSICVPTYKGKRGNPVLWGVSNLADMKKICGDVGARHLIGENVDQVFEVPFEDESIFVDVDTPQALEALT